MSFFNDIDKNDDNAIIIKFEPANVRDDFEYAFKMFSRSLDSVLPKKEADPYIGDFKYLSKQRYNIRNKYEGPAYSLRQEVQKVQQLIDDYIKSLDISELIDPIEVTYDNFLRYATKVKSERARTALIKNEARQIIKELAPTNPAYYEKLRERLEKIIEQEEKRRKDDASYFDSIAQVYNEALEPGKQRESLGFSTPFEFAVYEELQSIRKEDSISKKATN
jgi:type I restriction enzyme, R subunit